MPLVSGEDFAVAVGKGKELIAYLAILRPTGDKGFLAIGLVTQSELHLILNLAE